MKKPIFTSWVWASIIVGALYLYYEVVEVPTHMKPDFEGYRVSPPVTRHSKSNTTYQVQPPQQGAIELPSELRDYSKYRERMKNRGRTEEQISRDYARAIRKYLEDNRGGTYDKLYYEGIDPEYDLHENDDFLDELIPEY